MSTNANQFAQTATFTSTGGDVDFGFTASFLDLLNRAGKPIYVTLKSTTGATTGDYALESSGRLQLPVRCSGFSFVATSSGASFQIGAWG